MNIVKFKDVMLDETSGLTTEQIILFNDKFRNMYTYCINWKICINPKDITEQEYISMSREEMSTPSDCSFDYNTVKDYIDEVETDKLNSMSRYIYYNAFSPTDITEDDVKKFRTRLASTILSFNIILDNDINHVLDYYANGMYNDVVKALTTFGTSKIELNNITTSTCGCSQNNQTLLNPSLNACDPLIIYRKNIHDKMVEVFSDMNFWIDFDKDFLIMFKLYIDNIIKMNLPLGDALFDDLFVDCTCVTESDTAQKKRLEMLGRLSNSLQMMISGDTVGHKNYINKSLLDWSTYLYEIMEW